MTPRLRPFCSPRCADVDLGRWFSGDYAIPGPPPELDEDPPDSEPVATVLIPAPGWANHPSSPAPR